MIFVASGKSETPLPTPSPSQGWWYPRGLARIYYALLFVLVLLLCVSFALSGLRNFENVAHGVGRFPGSQSERAKRDCNVETIYSMDDQQCDAICKAPGIYRTKNGVCVNTIAFDASKAHAQQCSEKHGLLAYVTGNTQLGTTKMLCLSIDLGVQPDDARQKNTHCLNGSIDIDYVRSFPQLSSCRCAVGDVLTILESTSVIRARGVCVRKALVPVFQHNNLLYEGREI